MSGELVAGGAHLGTAVVEVPRGRGVVTAQQLRDEALSDSAKELVIRGVPASTLSMYARQWRYFRLWCEERARTFAPTSQNTLIQYLDGWRELPVHVRCAGGRQANGDKCDGHRPAPSTMWIWYSAVRFYHGIGEPPLPWEGGKRLALAMKGYADEMVDDLGWKPSKAPRAWPDHVMAMVDAMGLGDGTTVDDQAIGKHLRDRAIVLVNWQTGARASDLATYRIADAERNPAGYSLQLRKSKTNKNVGKKVETRTLRPNDANPQYCAVRALAAWIAWLTAHGITDGALFRPFSRPHTKQGVTRPGLLIRGRCDGLGYKMDGVSLSDIIRFWAVAAGIEGGKWFTCHSLRRGRASHLRELGFDSFAIARALGWAIGSAALATYLEEAEEFDPAAPAAAVL